MYLGGVGGGGMRTWTPRMLPSIAPLAAISCPAITGNNVLSSEGAYFNNSAASLSMESLAHTIRDTSTASSSDNNSPTDAVGGPQLAELSLHSKKVATAAAARGCIARAFARATTTSMDAPCISLGSETLQCLEE